MTLNNGAVCVAACVGVSPAKIYFSLKNNKEQMNKKSSNSLPSRLRLQRKTPISTTISRIFSNSFICLIWLKLWLPVLLFPVQRWINWLIESNAHIRRSDFSQNNLFLGAHLIQREANILGEPFWTVFCRFSLSKLVVYDLFV